MPQLNFEPPGPGTWFLNEVHCPRPLSRYFQEFYLDCFIEGANDGYGSYGLPFDWDSAIVNGWWYAAKRPVEGYEEYVAAQAEGDNNVTPTGEFNARVEAARTTFEDRRWRADLEQWDSEWKPDIQSRNRSLQTVTPAGCDDEGLVEHLRDCRDGALTAAYFHHRMSACANFPFADFLAFVREHTECSPTQAVSLMDGATPASAGAEDELGRVVAALEATDKARALLKAEMNPGEIIKRLREWEDGVGTAVEAWLDVVGYQPITGYDVADPYGLERPESLVSTLRTAVETDADHDTDRGTADRLASIRQQVPAGKRDTFDERFEEARLTYRVRDERSLLDVRTIGLVRRALIEAGQRLTNRGLIREASHAVDLEHEEVISALQGGPAPGAREVAAHAQHRTSHDSDDAPSVLGPDPSPPGPTEDLPGPMARLMRGREAVQWADAGGVPDAGDDEISGHGASPGTLRGPARVIMGPDDFDEIIDGDILVAEATSSAFNTILPLLGGIVTDKGGMLSHPAVVAREFGIPGVVGCENATDRIEDGDMIIVDGDGGVVRFDE